MFLNILIGREASHFCLWTFTLIIHVVLPAVYELHLNYCIPLEFYGLHSMQTSCVRNTIWTLSTYTHGYEESQHFWNFCKSIRKFCFGLADTQLTHNFTKRLINETQYMKISAGVSGSEWRLNLQYSGSAVKTLGYWSELSRCHLTLTGVLDHGWSCAPTHGFLKSWDVQREEFQCDNKRLLLHLTEVQRLWFGGHCSLMALAAVQSWARGLQSRSLLRFPGWRCAALLWNTNQKPWERKHEKHSFIRITECFIKITVQWWCTAGHPLPRLSLQWRHHYSQRLGALSTALRKVGQAFRTKRAAGGRVRVLRVVHRHAADHVRPLVHTTAERL